MVTRVGDSRQSAWGPLRRVARVRSEPGGGARGSVRLGLPAAWVWYAALAVAILWPLRHGGIALLLDWTPAPRLSASVDGPLGVQEWPLAALLRAVNLLIPTWILQRLILWGALACAGVAAHVTAPVTTARARLFAGTFYLVNPFTMARLAAGHWRILVAYALAPLAARAILRLVREPSRPRGITAGAWIAGAALVSAHFLLLCILLLAGFATAVVGRRQGTLGAFGMAVAIVGAGTLWWLVPAGLAGAPPGAGQSSLAVFQSSASGGASVFVSVLGLRGFWVERLNPTGPFGWPWLAILFLGLALLGAIRAARDPRRTHALVLLAGMAVAVFLALGVASPVTAVAARALYRWAPGLVAFREPHKLLALVALGYAWLGAIALEPRRAKRAHGKDRRWPRAHQLVGLLLAVSLPIAYTHEIFDGADGRIWPVQYPSSWSAADRMLQADPDPGRALVLPWKLYASLPFAGRYPVADPARGFFSIPTVASEDPHLGPGPSPHTDPARRSIDLLITHHDEVVAFGAAVAHLDIKYILLIPSPDGDAYAFLFRQPDLRVVSSSADLVVFRNGAWKPAS